MLEITLRYFPFSPEAAFLQIKQTEVTQIGYYLPIFYIHVCSAMFCLPAGFTQFNRAILKQRKKLHRVLGFIYIVSVLFFAAPSGFVIGLHANGGWVAKLFFTTLAILWFIFTLKAWIAVKNKAYEEHRQLMMRSYALALSAITLRLWKVILVKLFHPAPMDVYMIISGLGWVPNLLWVEYLLLRRKAKQNVHLAGS
ncbi:hypothetical protein DBR32_04815 [Taibaiella sp. KBW10]|nr:hypothetical protein DBR32_04815 [Taibaiella sp. KBW10]